MANDNQETEEAEIPTAREIADQVDANVHDPLDVLTGGNDPDEDES